VVCLNDKQKKNSKLEVYSFKHTGVIHDSYVNKIGGATIPDIYAPVEKAFSFKTCLGGGSNLNNEKNAYQNGEKQVDLDEEESPSR